MNRNSPPVLLVGLTIAGMLCGVFIDVRTATAATGMELRINEIMYDPPQQNSGKNLQWLEVYNQNDRDLTLIGGVGGWTVTDAGGAHFLALQPAQGSMTIQAHGYAVFAGDSRAFLSSYPFFLGTVIDVSLALGENSGTVVVKDTSGTVAAQTSWISTQGGARDGKTLEYSSRDNTLRESLVIAGTPGQKNSVEGILLSPVSPTSTPSAPNQIPQPVPMTQPTLPLVAVNEIYANPLADQAQWVELKNNDALPVSLAGWKLRIGSQSQSALLNGTITPGSFMVVSASAFGFSMNTASDTLQLFNSQNDAVFEVKYSTAVPRGWSANRLSSQVWELSSVPTPGKENVIRMLEPTHNTSVSETVPAYPLAAAVVPTTASRIAVPVALPAGMVGFGLGAAIVFLVLRKKIVY